MLLLNRSVEPTEPIRNDRGHLLPVRSPTRKGLKMRDDSLTLRTINDVRELESMRGIWERWPGSRDSDLDFFCSMVRSRGSNCRPHVIVLSRFAKVPKRRPKFSARAIWARDGGRCQYTGQSLRPGDGNIDHVLPRSRGGKTSWENCVLASKEVNSRKADRLPEEVGLRLLKAPAAPRELPSTLFIRNVNRIAAWRNFLVE